MEADAADAESPALLQSLCLWLVARAPPSVRVSSLQGALQPTLLLAVLADLLPAPAPGEPSLADARGDDEALVTVYVNACRRAGLRRLFDANSHPSLRGGALGGGDGGAFDAGVAEVLRNVTELRALAEARDRHDLARAAAGAAADASADAGDDADAVAAADAGADADADITPLLLAAAGAPGAPARDAAPRLLYAEHCALFTGRLDAGVSPAGRERLWRWLLVCEPDTVHAVCAAPGRAYAAAAARRVNEARRAFGASNAGAMGGGGAEGGGGAAAAGARSSVGGGGRGGGSSGGGGGGGDEALMLLHALMSPGYGLVLARRRLVRALARAGLPPRLRGMLWARFAGAGDGPGRWPAPAAGTGAGAPRKGEGLLQAASATEVAVVPAVTPLGAAADGAEATLQLPAHLSRYDHLLLANAAALAPEDLPCHLRSLVAGAGGGGGGGRGDIGGDSGGSSIGGSALAAALAQEGIAAADSRAIAQIDADLRRTMQHLPSIERARLPVTPAAKRNGAEEVGGAPALADAENDPPLVLCVYRRRTVAPAAAIAAAVPPEARAPACRAAAPVPAAWSGPCTCGHAAQFALAATDEGAGTGASTGAVIGGAPTVAVGRGAVRRVLLALASQLPAVGYCQGLNWLAAHALRWTGEADALCLLSLLVTRECSALRFCAPRAAPSRAQPARALPTLTARRRLPFRPMLPHSPPTSPLAGVLAPGTYTDLSGAAAGQAAFGEVVQTALPLLVAHLARLADHRGPARVAQERAAVIAAAQAQARALEEAEATAAAAAAATAVAGAAPQAPSAVGRGGAPKSRSRAAKAAARAAAAAAAAGAGARDPRPAVDLLTSVTL
jgi:hypothetical protein